MDHAAEQRFALLPELRRLSAPNKGWCFCGVSQKTTPAAAAERHTLTSRPPTGGAGSELQEGHGLRADSAGLHASSLQEGGQALGSPHAYSHCAATLRCKVEQRCGA
jgi:hypothetical protein